jgi:hypothetical protein
VGTVRIEFAKSIPSMKPYLEYDLDLNLEIMEIVNNLKADKDRDVVEAVEQSDHTLLQQRKRTKEEEKKLAL